MVHRAVMWRPSRNDGLRPLDASDRDALAHLLGGTTVAAPPQDGS
jgi:hypothetical protein